MKIIISRKGFDAENGGMASPIMPDGTMLSFPIPSGDNNDFSDLVYKGKTYEKLMDELKPGQYFYGCHIDPDIRRNAHKNLPKDWKPVFGQCNAAETHLENKGVEVGDLFLFFGWFKQTEEVNGRIKYKKGAKDIHAIYGYLQIGKIAKDDETLAYNWHPHCYVEKTNERHAGAISYAIDMAKGYSLNISVEKKREILADYDLNEYEFDFADICEEAAIIDLVNKYGLPLKLKMPRYYGDFYYIAEKNNTKRHMIEGTQYLNGEVYRSKSYPYGEICSRYDAVDDKNEIDEESEDLKYNNSIKERIKEHEIN